MDYNTRYISVLIFTMMLAPGCLSLEDIEPEVIRGCTDEVALNFDENANSNDGTCEYEPEETFEGCTSSSAVNFNPEALINDGSCVFKASAPEIDSALRDISEALHAFQSGGEMESNLFLTSEAMGITMTATHDSEGTTLHGELTSENLDWGMGPDSFSISDSSGLVTSCGTVSGENSCFEFRNHGDDGAGNIGKALEMMLLYWTMEDYELLSSLEIPPGTEWQVSLDGTDATHQTAIYQNGGLFISAQLTVSSISLISLEVNGFELSLSDDLIEMPSDDDMFRASAEIVWDVPEITNNGPVYIWSCTISMVDLDSLDNEDVDTVYDALYNSDTDYPDFCGEPVANDPENGTFSSTGPFFDTRWGVTSHIYDPQTEDYKEVVVEIDNRPTSTVWYLLDVTADECSENEGTYDPITQTCEWSTQEGNNTASDLYRCTEYDPDWGEFCQRYGINADGHLIGAWEIEDSDGGGGGGSDDSEMIWECRDSFFAEDTTPLSSDDDEDVQAEVDTMSAPAWCGQIIEWNGSFESDPSSESTIANSNWNNPDSFYLDFTSAGALNFGDRSVTQSECSEYGGSWNAIEEACEFPNGEWIANETLVEIDLGWGMIERLRYELIEGGIVLAFPAENGSGTGTPNMANTHYEGWDETGYHTYDFTASEDGLHIIESAQEEDGYLYLYEGSFDSQNPLTNVLASQDDWDIDSYDWGSSIHWDLVSGQDYVVVTTTYSSDSEMIFDNSITSPSETVTDWSGSIDSDSPTFVRPDGYWEDDGGGSGGGGSGMTKLTSVSDDHWNEVSLDELTLEIYSDEGLIGTASMSDALTEFDWGSVAILDNDGNGLLSAGDEVVIQSDIHDEVWSNVWDDWADGPTMESRSGQ
jgi:hypothetical protein